MGATKWTKEQLTAINTRNCNLLVAAAAGSGKTAVLVERIINIITSKENPVDIDKLLVVTFTNAAAAEMRERVALAISEQLDKTPNSKHLQRQLTLLNIASITTIHSFCLDTIRNNYHKIDLDPSFRIGDQTECILMKSEVIEELFEDEYENNNLEFMDLVEAFNSYKNDENLKNVILNLYNFVMSGPWPEKWLLENAQSFDIDSLEELNKSKWFSTLKDSIEIEIRGYITSFEYAIKIIKKNEWLDPYLQNLISELDCLKEVYESLNLGIEELYNAINKIEFKRLKTIKKSEIIDEKIQNNVKKIRDDVKKRIVELRENVFSLQPNEIVEKIKGVYPYINSLAEVVIEFSRRFAAKKKSKNILDFNDLEHLCLKILIDRDEEGNIIPSNASNKFREYFDEVLVDEYQDSNNIQETIINLVSRKELQDPNVFMVGDVKQSIYRFRQAEPELFINKYNNYSNEKGINRKVMLYKNFRSREEIIDGINYLFKTLMSTTVGELEYTEEESLNLGADFKKVEKSENIIGGPIEVCIIEKNNDDESTSENISEDEEVTGINLEGRFVANKIKEMMSPNNSERFKVLDKKTGDYRNLQYRDIVILLRATKNYSEVLLEELGLNQIPAYADTGTGYFESIEIRTIMSLLKIIDNPMQDIPIVAILKSPIGGFSAEELVDIRLENKEKYLYENIKSISKIKTLSDDNMNIHICDELINKCNRFIEKLNVWRNKSIYMPIDEFIWFLYMDTSYYGYVGAMPNGVLRQANLKVLFQRAKQFEQTSFKGLFNFINFINRLTKSSGDMGSAKILGENEDVVRIMSIHKSKGLEFPVVFLCGCGKNFNMMDLNSNILYHKELGFGLDYVDLEKRLSIPTLAKESIKKKMKFEILSEEMRVLYVALTRAKEKLVIVGSINDVDKSIEKWFNTSILGSEKVLESEVIKGKSYLDWIGMALCKHTAAESLLERINESNEYLRQDKSKWKIYNFNKSELLNLAEKTNEIEKSNINLLDKEIDEDIYSEINNRLAYKYPYKNSTILKSNISISDLKKRDSQNDENNTIELYKEKEIMVPKFLQGQKDFTPAEKGTIVHKVMRNINLERVNTIKEIHIQVREMVDKELLSEAEGKTIRANKIFKYFNSKLGKMMLLAYKENPKNIHREVPFYTYVSSREIDNNLDELYDNEKIRLQGIIDCFFIINNKVILLDYKTDYIEKGNEDELVQKYKKQLEYYEDAVIKILNKKVDEKYLYSFSLGERIKL